MRRTVISLWVPLLAVLAMLGSGAWLAVQNDGPGHGSAPGVGWSTGDGDPVDDVSEARTNAEEFAGTLAPGLQVGEVMQFTRNYYAELEESDGTKVTEVLIDPRNGAVRLEFGPAMMWNTRYGMSRSDAPPDLSDEQALDIAREWATDRDGLTVDDPEYFPGYYTVHTVRGDRIEGMLSVNAATGNLWYHSWHGQFLDMTEG